MRLWRRNADFHEDFFVEHRASRPDKESIDAHFPTAVSALEKKSRVGYNQIRDGIAARRGIADVPTDGGAMADLDRTERPRPDREMTVPLLYELRSFDFANLRCSTQP